MSTMPESTALLTRREAAEFTGAPLATIDKAIEQRVVSVKRGPRRQSFLPSEELYAIWVLGHAELALPVRVKRQIRDWLVHSKPYRSQREQTLALGESLVVRCGAETAAAVKRAERYAKQRDRYIVSDPGIKGGEPIIKGTRIDVHAVAARLAGGETIDDLAQDWPHVSRAALEAANLYARTHPKRGRPIRPWRT
jgi:uncharacterized protein (DUF433 family)